MSKEETKRQANTRRRNTAIMERLKELHEIKRIRYDDCIEKLALEFFMEKITIYNIIAAN